MRCRGVVLLLVLLFGVDCRNAEKSETAAAPEPRSATADTVERSDDASPGRGAALSVVKVTHATPAIDWQQSAGIFIGIERFHPGADRPVAVDYAADDATDLAYFFAKERKEQTLLSASRTVLLLSGRPRKPQSRQRLEELERDANVIHAGQNVCINASMIYGNLDRLAGQVGRNGILIVSIATHGYTVGGQQLLLTCDSPLSQPKGVILGRMLQALSKKSGRRVLLLVDACRTPHSGAAFAFEDLDLPAGYAVLSASSPRRAARSDDAVKNGFFTCALVEGLRCGASAGSDGKISPRELDAYVGPRVGQLSRGWQQPEGRFAGSLGDLELVTCSTGDVATMSEPRPGSYVEISGRVKFDVLLPDLYATVLVCAAGNGTCYNQNPGFTPLPMHLGMPASIKVWYGGLDRFHVWVALTPDSAFLRDEREFASYPLELRAERTVYWLGPVDVTRTN